MTSQEHIRQRAYLRRRRVNRIVIGLVDGGHVLWPVLAVLDSLGDPASGSGRA